MGSGASTADAQAALKAASPGELQKALAAVNPETRAKLAAALEVARSDKIEKTLASVTDIAEIGEFVGKVAWNNTENVEVKDNSGRGGGRVYFVSRGSEKVVLKIKSDGLASLSSARMAAATKVMQEAGICPKPVAEGPDWVIDTFAGESVQKDRFHFEDSTAPVEALAKLLAKVHSIDTKWYESYKQRTISRDERLKDLLAAQPAYSHCWHPHCYGLESGMVFLPLPPGGGVNRDVARDIFERQVQAGTLQKFLSCSCFHPVSDSGKRVVTLHNDFKPDNILRAADGSLVAIDYEFVCAGPAAMDLGMQLLGWMGGHWGRDWNYRFTFIQTYLQASQLPAGDAEVRALMLDAEIATLGNPVAGLLANIWDSQVPLLRGQPHPTPATKELPFGSESLGCQTSDSPTAIEVLDLIASAIAEIRGSPELVDTVLQDGAVKTIKNKKAGSAELHAFVYDLAKRNMLRVFGIAP